MASGELRKEKHVNQAHHFKKKSNSARKTKLSHNLSPAWISIKSLAQLGYDVVSCNRNSAGPSMSLLCHLRELAERGQTQSNSVVLAKAKVNEEVN